MQEEEPRDRRDEAQDGLSILRVGVVDQPVALVAQLDERLRLEVVLVLQRAPLAVGDDRRHDGHHLVLLPLQVREQELCELVEGGDQLLARHEQLSAWLQLAAAASTVEIAAATSSWSACMASSSSAAAGSRCRTNG